MKKKNDSLILKKKISLENKTKKKNVLKLLIKLKIINENNKKEISEKRYLVYFKRKNFLSFLKENNAKAQKLPSETIILNEIQRIAYNEELDNYKIFLLKKFFLISTKKEKDLLQYIMNLIKKKVKIIKSIFQNNLGFSQTMAKFETCSYFETSKKKDNIKKNQIYLNCDSLKFFYHSLNTESGKLLDNHIFYANLKYYSKNLKNETIEDLVKFFENKKTDLKNYFSILVLSKPLINLEKVPIENYLKIYKDVLNRASLPEWMDMNFIYLFKIDKNKVIEKIDKKIPYQKIIKLT